MLVAGIDVGSEMTKCVLVDAEGWMRGRGHVLAHGRVERIAREALASARIDAGPDGGEVGYVATTGLGRYAVPFGETQITELACGARGAVNLFPDAGLVLDVGVQWARAIRLQEGGPAEALRRHAASRECAVLAEHALSVLERVGLDGPVVLIGGLMREEGMVEALRDKLGVTVHVPAAPELVTALGAALLGLQRFRQRATAVASRVRNDLRLA
jgi:activator of 2-hydroxyglutaryl-CoA dehydratase